MKHVLLALAMLGSARSQGQCDIDICGYWYSENYNSGVPVEYMSIDMVNGSWVCTKVLGDAFVPTGNVTWQGTPQACTFPGEIFGSSGLGQPLVPIPCSIQIISEDHIQVSGIGTLDFHRSNTDHLTYVGVDYSAFPVSCIECPSAFPNIFTPNGDGLNDLLEQMCGGQAHRFAITDRWGNTLFETDDPDPVWDGRHGWSPCPEGVYYWALITADDRTGIIKRGFVHLLR
jgi:gliding motility-associated-like protein